MEGKICLLLPWGSHLSSSLPKYGDRHRRYSLGRNKALSRETVQYSGSQMLSKLIIALKIQLWASSGPHFPPGHAERGFAAPGRRTRTFCSPTAFPQPEQRTHGSLHVPGKEFRCLFSRIKSSAAKKKKPKLGKKKHPKTEIWMGGLQDRPELQSKRHRGGCRNNSTSAA